MGGTYRVMGVIAAASFLASAGASPNIVTNGSFEDPDIDATLTDGMPYYLYARVEPEALTGWTVTGDDLALLDSRPGAWIADDGAQFITLESGFGSSIAQSVPTIPGRSYVLTFSYAPDPFAGSFSLDDSLTIRWDGVTVETIDWNETGFQSLVWTTFEYELPAVSTETSLEFSDGHPGVSYLGPMIDGISLTLVPTCPGDADGDGDVDFDDLNQVLAGWQTAGPDGDVDGSGFVDFDDLNLVLSNWGGACDHAVADCPS